MDSDLLAIAARHVERLLIVLAGGLSIVLGYRMFLAIPKAQNEGEGRIQLPGGVSIYVTRVGPGAFFAPYGAAILGLGLACARGACGGERGAAPKTGVSRRAGVPGPVMSALHSTVLFAVAAVAVAAVAATATDKDYGTIYDDGFLKQTGPPNEEAIRY